MPIRRLHAVCASLAAVGLIGCGGIKAPIVSSQSYLPDDVLARYPEANPALHEKMQEDEKKTALEIGDVIAASIARKYPSGKLSLRDAHPKAHGCVSATFTVADIKDGEFRQGVFSTPGKKYRAWIRFSNSDENAQNPDIEPDGRGMAIKLMGVEGENLVKEGPIGTQDFIMISYPAFIMDEPSKYLSLVSAVNATGLAKVFAPVKTIFALGFTGLHVFRATKNKQIENPLKTRYWSMVPYQLGSIPIKFSAQPEGGEQPQDIPTKPVSDDNYLRTHMAETLRSGPFKMDFMVQKWVEGMSVEDSQVAWADPDDKQFEDQLKDPKVPRSAFVRVATIEIDKQVFDTRSQNEMCENLSMNPWHALATQRPLGSMNRMRKVIYERISEERRSMNAASRDEPPMPPPAPE